MPLERTAFPGGCDAHGWMSRKKSRARAGSGRWCHVHPPVGRRKSHLAILPAGAEISYPGAEEPARYVPGSWVRGNQGTAGAEIAGGYGPGAPAGPTMPAACTEKV